MQPAVAAYLFEAFEVWQRIGVVVDAQVEMRPFVLAVDQKRRRLLAALVSAGGFARSHRRDQALREGQAFASDVGLGRVVEDARAGQHVAGHRKTRSLELPAPVDAIAPGMSCDATKSIHDVKLPALRTS